MAQNITLNNGDVFKIGNVAYVALVMPYNSLLFRPIDMNSGSDINMIKIVDANYFGEKTPEPTYEYEMFFKSTEDDFVKIDGWCPVATDRIKDPEKIEEYIQKGILRKRLTT